MHSVLSSAPESPAWAAARKLAAAGCKLPFLKRATGWEAASTPCAIVLYLSTGTWGGICPRSAEEIWEIVRDQNLVLGSLEAITGARNAVSSNSATTSGSVGKKWPRR